MNRAQRIAAILGVVVASGAIIFFVSSPFTLSRGTITGVSGEPGSEVVKIPVRVHCRSASISAFEKQIPRGVPSTRTEVAAEPEAFDRTGTCRGPARQRLAGSAIVVMLAGVVAVGLLRSRSSSPSMRSRFAQAS